MELFHRFLLLGAFQLLEVLDQLDHQTGVIEFGEDFRGLALLEVGQQLDCHVSLAVVRKLFQEGGGFGRFHVLEPGGHPFDVVMLQGVDILLLSFQQLGLFRSVLLFLGLLRAFDIELLQEGLHGSNLVADLSPQTIDFLLFSLDIGQHQSVLGLLLGELGFAFVEMFGALLDPLAVANDLLDTHWFRTSGDGEV